ncbi:MAG: right-handed parallel beta-helix repeat-containing protein [Saprospiraceae bacterium]|nr:right-handed parallel beta-helix repeat-containing protein [Saprospiraceae bacterium]
MKNSILSIVPFLFILLGCPANKKEAVVESEVDFNKPSMSQIVTERPPNYPGYVPDININERGKSKFHTPTPELTALKDIKSAKATIITPQLGGWDKVPWADSNIEYYLITPGDYVGWGELNITVSGRAGAPKVLMYYDPSMGDKPNTVVHGYTADKAGYPVLIEGIRIGTKSEGNAHWTISGLTLKGNSWTKGSVSAGSGLVILPGAKNIKIVNCFAWRWRGARLYGDNIVFQDNVVGGSLQMRGDHGAVGIFTTKEAGSYNCRIVGNEIFDQADLAGAPKDGDEATEFGFVNGLVIADNDLYWTEEARFDYGDGLLYNCGGDGIDIKNGSNDPTNPVQIIGNRIAYCYPTPPDKSCGDNTGSYGQAMMLHKDLRNTVIKDNIFYNVSVGIVAYKDRKGFLTDNIVIQNNLFHTCIEQIPDVTGYALKATASNVDFIWNTVVDSGQFISITRNGKSRLDVRGNRYIGPEKGMQKSVKSQTVKDNYISREPDIPLGDLAIIWHPHTGMETLVLPHCVLYKKDLNKIAGKYPSSGMDEYMARAWWVE